MGTHLDAIKSYLSFVLLLLFLGKNTAKPRCHCCVKWFYFFIFTLQLCHYSLLRHQYKSTFQFPQQIYFLPRSLQSMTIDTIRHALALNLARRDTIRNEPDLLRKSLVSPLDMRLLFSTVYTQYLTNVWVVGSLCYLLPCRDCSTRRKLLWWYVTVLFVHRGWYILVSNFLTSYCSHMHESIWHLLLSDSGW